MTEPEEGAAKEPKSMKYVFRKPAAEEAPLARYFTRYVSYPFTLLLIRTSVTPNQVTIAFILAFLAGGFCQLDQVHRIVPMIGALLMWLGLVLDTVDGEIARYKKIFSVKGVYLDMLSHRIIHSILFACTGIGLWLRDRNVIALLLSMGAIYGELSFTLILYTRWRCLLDYPNLMLQEVERLSNTPKKDLKRAKAGFVGDAPKKNPISTFYDVWFGKDYVGAILITNFVLCLLDRNIILLWIYGTFLPLRATITFIHRMIVPFRPENVQIHSEVTPPV